MENPCIGKKNDKINFYIIYYVIVFYKRVVILFIFSYFILFFTISLDGEYKIYIKLSK